jgi:hypothetical protein
MLRGGRAETETPVTDLLIAATAAAHQATLWTRNASDLIGLEGMVDVHQPVLSLVRTHRIVVALRY